MCTSCGLYFFSIRAGLGHYFYGPGRVSGQCFWPGSGSGYCKTPTGWFRAKKTKKTKIRANFRAKFGPFSGQTELLFKAVKYKLHHKIIPIWYFSWFCAKKVPYFWIFWIFLCFAQKNFSIFWFFAKLQRKNSYTSGHSGQENITSGYSGLHKNGPGRVGPLKNHGPRAKIQVGLWPDPALDGSVHEPSYSKVKTHFLWESFWLSHVYIKD